MSFIDTAASYLYWQANDVTWEMYHNAVGAPTYRATYREMYKLMQTVKTISAAIRDEEVGAVGPAFLENLTADLLEANGMLQAVQSDVARWPSPEEGEGMDVQASLLGKLERMSGTLSDIMEVVGIPPVRSNFGAAGANPPATGPRSQPQARPVPQGDPTPLPEPAA